MKITILGAGAYGLALAEILKENKNEVCVWTPLEKEALILNNENMSSKLPGIKINTKVTNDLEKALKNSKLIVIAVPTAFLTSTIKKLKKYYDDVPICIATKGIEQNTNLFVYDVCKNILDTDNIAVISGPSFAIDIVKAYPAGLTLACQDKETINLVSKAFVNNHFKLRKSPDIIGTEICGSIKNIIAIASGILAGLNMPESTKAMLITESLHDIKALIKGLGGDGDTVLSYAGFGDLLLTATSPKSRNYSLGFLIGSGKSKDEIQNYIKNTTVEGLYTLKSVKELVKDKDVDMPIIDLIDKIIYHGENPKILINFLIEKP